MELTKNVVVLPTLLLVIYVFINLFYISNRVYRIHSTNQIVHERSIKKKSRFNRNTTYYDNLA